MSIVATDRDAPMLLCSTDTHNLFSNKWKSLWSSFHFVGVCSFVCVCRLYAPQSVWMYYILQLLYSRHIRHSTADVVEWFRCGLSHHLIISSLKDVMQMLIIPTDLTYFMVESRCQSNESISFKHNHDKHQKSQQGFPSVRQTHFKTFSLSLLSGKLLQNNFQPFCSLFSLSLSPLKCVASGREPTKKKERKNEITKKKKLDCETHGEERQRACRM